MKLKKIYSAILVFVLACAVSTGISSITGLGIYGATITTDESWDSKTSPDLYENVPDTGSQQTEQQNTDENAVQNPPAVNNNSSSAENNEETPAPSFWSSSWVLLIYVAFIPLLYFLFFRPQRKREKAMQTLQASITSGDNVVTSSGFYGRVVDVGEDCFVIEFGTNKGIRIPVRKNDVIAKKEPQTTKAVSTES